VRWRSREGKKYFRDKKGLSGVIKGKDAFSSGTRGLRFPGVGNFGKIKGEKGREIGEDRVRSGLRGYPKPST